MFNLFQKKQERQLGIDLGTSAIKVVELEKKNQRFVLSTYGIFPFKKYLSVPREEATNYEYDFNSTFGRDFSQLIKDALKTARVRTNEASVSFPIFSSFSTIIDLPETMSEKEMAAAIPFEAKRYIPIPMAEVELDWTIIDAEGGFSRVLLVAVTKDILKRYTKLSASTGLKVNSFEVEAFSLVRSLVGKDKSGILLIDIGARNTNVIIVNGGLIREVHNLRLGGAEMTELFSRRLNIDMETAEMRKRFSHSYDSEFKEAYLHIANLFLGKISMVMDDYKKRYKKDVDKCILSGGAGIPFLKDYFAQRLKMDVVVGNCFAKVQYPPELENALKEIGPSLAVAVGLAMKGI